MKPLFAYGCASPIRLPIVQAVARGSMAHGFFPEASPSYRGGDSIVWGLIRGAHEIMVQTHAQGHDFFQIDNAYFGRNIYYRLTPNALQLSALPQKIVNNRYVEIFKQLNKQILPWKTMRNGPIVICPSSEFLYQFYGTSLDAWLASTVDQIRLHTDRPIIVRYKELMPKDDIDQAIQDAWCVVTHVSAAALDALRMGVPVVTTGHCAASPLATPLASIERPRQEPGREELFSLLANGQFTTQEFEKMNCVDLVRQLTPTAP